MTITAGVGTSHHHNPSVAFHTIGEIGPVEEHNDHHPFTSVVLALS